MGSLGGGGGGGAVPTSQTATPNYTPIQPASSVMPVAPPGAANNAFNQFRSFMGYEQGDPSQAFNNYLDSTGYRFAMDEGTNAITNSAAARGLLNSGATAKALQNYGQNQSRRAFTDWLGLQRQYANDYLQSLSGLNSMQGGTAGMGQNALGTLGSLGSQGGGAAANAIMQGAAGQGNALMSAGAAQGNSISGAFNMLGRGLSNMGNPFAPSSGGLTPGTGGLY